LDSSRDVHCRDRQEFSLLVKLEFGDVAFCGERKTGEPEEKASEQAEIEPGRYWREASS